MARGGDALAHHIKGADVLPHRRDRRGGYHVATRKNRRRAQLGLSNLLAARFDLHPLRAIDRRLPRGSEGVAAMATTRDRRRARQDADHVWTARRAAATGVGSPMARGIRE